MPVRHIRDFGSPMQDLCPRILPPPGSALLLYCDLISVVTRLAVIQTASTKTSNMDMI